VIDHSDSFRVFLALSRGVGEGSDNFNKLVSVASNPLFRLKLGDFSPQFPHRF